MHSPRQRSTSAVIQIRGKTVTCHAPALWGRASRLERRRIPIFAARWSALVAVALLLSATQAHASPLNSAGAIILTPFDNFFSSFSTFMTGTVARVGSLAALVICGISYASGEPGAKKMAVGTAVGVGIANMAASCLTWFST